MMKLLLGEELGTLSHAEVQGNDKSKPYAIEEKEYFEGVGGFTKSGRHAVVLTPLLTALSLAVCNWKTRPGLSGCPQTWI